jgi:glucose-1-phosphate cytidylyltransferase
MKPHGAIPTIILCGGRGTRMREVSATLPKPMVTIGERPMLWHVMKLYASYGYANFVLALGYLSEVIKEFFLHYEPLMSDFSIELGKPGSISYIGAHPEQGWKVSCIDTGLESLTGTRVYRASRHLADGTIMVTYGDGIGDVDVQSLVDFHYSHGRLATITSVRPPGRFGELRIDDRGQVTAFEEKPQTSTDAINGGFMVFEKEAIDRYIGPEVDVMLEREPLSRLAAERQLMAYQHSGFWQPIDTPRERDLLADMWNSGQAPWKRWA